MQQRKPRPGDRVVVREAPSWGAGEVVKVLEREALVKFEDGRTFVDLDDLRVLTRVEEIQERREKVSKEQELSSAAAEHGYYTPETTRQSYEFGKNSAQVGHARMERHEFLATSGDHPFPNSLWRAYLRGFGKGKEIRDKRNPST